MKNAFQKYWFTFIIINLYLEASLKHILIFWQTLFIFKITHHYFNTLYLLNKFLTQIYTLHLSTHNFLALFKFPIYKFHSSSELKPNFIPLNSLYNNFFYFLKSQLIPFTIKIQDLYLFQQYRSTT